MLKKLIWLYILLWVIEGALRFWILPSLSQVLLLVRDPVVLAIYFVAFRERRFPTQFGCICLLLSFMTMALAITAGHGNLAVALFGVRATFLHLPLIFVIPRVLDHDEVLRIGKWFLFAMMPMALLTVYQFKSSPAAWINQGGMMTHYGTVRPSGTFSFCLGLIAFTTMCAAFLADSFTRLRRYPFLLVIGCTGAIITTLAVSGSRGAIASVCLVGIAMVGITLVRGAGRAIRSLFLGGLVVGSVLIFVASSDILHEGAGQLQKRFSDASQRSESMTERILKIFTEPIGMVFSHDMVEGFFGEGIGIGTNAGAVLMTGKRQFLVAETEWSRILLELGPLVGIIVIGMRVGIGWKLFSAAWRASHQGNLLPMLLFGAVAFSFVAGQWSVPSMQGFCTFGAGLIFAACRPPKQRRWQSSESLEVKESSQKAE